MSDHVIGGKPWAYGPRSWPVAAAPTVRCAACGEPRNKLATWRAADGSRRCRACISDDNIVPAGDPRRRRRKAAA